MYMHTYSLRERGEGEGRGKGREGGREGGREIEKYNVDDIIVY